MFQQLVAFGFKEIEVGFPSASQVEWDFVRRRIDDDLIHMRHTSPRGARRA